MRTYFVLNLIYICAVARTNRKHKISGGKQRGLRVWDVCVTLPILVSRFAKEKCGFSINILV